MPWEKNFEVEDVLEKAMQAFWKQGYEATSMKTLSECMGLNPGSIYAEFGSKKNLFLSTLDHYLEQTQALLAGFEESHSPLGAILAVFDHMTEDVKHNPDNAGCYLVNSVLECSPKDKDIDKAVHAGMEAFDTTIQRLIAQGQKTGEINPGLDPAKTARILHGLVAGGRVMSKGRPNETIMQDIREHAESILRN